MEESKVPQFVKVMSIMPANLFVLNMTMLEFHGRVVGRHYIRQAKDSEYLLTEYRLPLVYRFDMEQL